MQPEDSISRDPRQIIRDAYISLKQAWYEQSRDTELDLRALHALGFAVNGMRRDVFRDIMIDEMQGPDEFNRTNAAFTLLSLFGVGPFIEEAKLVAEEALRSTDPCIVLLALFNLGNLPVAVPEFLAPIRSHMDSGGEPAFMAAIAGIRYGSERQRCLGDLLCALHSPNCNRVFSAAVTLIREGLQLELAWDALLKCGRNLPRNDFLESIAVTLTSVAPSRFTAKKLLAIAADKTVTIQTRASCARLLALAAPDWDKAQNFLVDLTLSDDWEVILSASDALSLQHFKFPNEAKWNLVHKLSNKSDKVREAAAMTLYTVCAPINEEQAAVVAERLVVESHLETFGLLLEGCIAAGDVALGAVVNALNHATHIRKLLIYTAMTKMGENAVCELVRCLAGALSTEARQMVAGALVGLRINSPDAVAQLGDMLQSDDSELSNMALKVLINSGENAAFLTPQLLQHATGDDTHKASLASQAIISIGRKALPYFEGPPDEEPENLTFLRRAIEQQGRMSGEHELSWFDDLASLKVFVLFASQVDTDNGCSYANAARILVERQLKGEIDIELSVSESSLRSVVSYVQKRLDERWGITAPLFEYRSKKWHITVPGSRFYKSVVRYLALVN